MRYLFLLLVTAILSGCTVDTVNEEDACVPNTTQECMCPGGIEGSQTCSKDGSEWEKCVCLDIQDDTGNETTDDTAEEIFVQETQEEDFKDFDQETQEEDSQDSDGGTEETDSGEEEFIEPDCTDLDEDNHYGHGEDCDPESDDYDCDEERPDIYRGAEELCDNVDNDCDGETDEDYELLTDSANCGECGSACSEGEECRGGICSCGLGFCSANEICRRGECCSEGKCSTPMATVPAGAFMMGCNISADFDCGEDEDLYHEVIIPEFQIDVAEVRVIQYRACTEDNENCSEPDPNQSTYYCNWRHSAREDHPVNCVDWIQAKAYCEWSGKRLCTESEWEKGARGTDGRVYSWGNEEATCDYAVMCESVREDGDCSLNAGGCGEDLTWPVGSKPAGVYGLYDMAGNMHEWVEDDYHETYDGAPDDGTPWTDDPRAANRVFRGGNFNLSFKYLRSSKRDQLPSDQASLNIGFRCCR